MKAYVVAALLISTFLTSFVDTGHFSSVDYDTEFVKTNNSECCPKTFSNNVINGDEGLIGFGDHTRTIKYIDFEFVKGDIRDREDAKKAVEGIYAVAHLAAIVGDPACAKSPELARQTNLEGSKMFYEVANAAGVERFVFASTCSNYGKMDDLESFVKEDSKEELICLKLYLLALKHVLVEDSIFMH